MKYVIWLIALYSLTFHVRHSRLEAEEKAGEVFQLAETPVVQENWTWTYRAVEKFYAGVWKSNTLNGEYQLDYHKGRVQFLQQDGTALLGVANPREISLMVPVARIIQTI